MASRPNPPGLQEKIEFIWREIIDPCDAPISIWFECMWQPLWLMVLEWFAIDLWQILTTYARPNLFYGTTRIGGHGSSNKGKKRGFWRDKFGKILSFDINDFIGNLLPFGEEIKEEHVSLGRARLWLIFGVIERVSFWWFVAELTTDFLYRWMSAVAESKYCQARDNAVFLSNLPSGVTIGVAGWLPSYWGTPLKSRRITFYNGFGVEQNTAIGIATTYGACHAIEPVVPGYIRCRMRIVAGPQAGKIVEETIHTTADETVSMSLFVEILPGDLVVVETSANGPAYLWTSNMFLVQASP